MWNNWHVNCNHPFTDEQKILNNNNMSMQKSARPCKSKKIPLLICQLNSARVYKIPSPLFDRGQFPYREREIQRSVAVHFCNCDKSVSLALLQTRNKKLYMQKIKLRTMKYLDFKLEKIHLGTSLYSPSHDRMAYIIKGCHINHCLFITMIIQINTQT